MVRVMVILERYFTGRMRVRGRVRVKVGWTVG
jgi:hypothetical protein